MTAVGFCGRKIRNGKRVERNRHVSELFQPERFMRFAGNGCRGVVVIFGSSISVVLEVLEWWM